MAKRIKIIDTDTDLQTAKRILDKIWQEKHGFPMYDWIVNKANSADDLRAMGNFMQPNMVELIGDDLHFKETDIGQMAERVWRNVFFGILQKYGFLIHKAPIVEAIKWQDMTDQEQVRFAKAIWAKRPVIGAEPCHYAHYIQETLCRLKNAPPPEILKGILLKHNIDLGSIFSNGKPKPPIEPTKD